MFIASNKITKKLMDLFSNNQVTQNQWKFDIPEDIVEQPIHIIATAKNFADGINYQIDRHGIDIPEKLMVASNDYKEYITSEGELVDNLDRLRN